MPRDLKEPEGCRFSSFKKTLLRAEHVNRFAQPSIQIVGVCITYQPAARDKVADLTSGVSMYGILILLAILSDLRIGTG